MPQLGNFRGKLLSSRTFVWNKTFIIGLLWTYTLIFWNQFFLKIALSYSFFESWILNIQSWSLNQIGFNLIWRSNSATVSKQSESFLKRIWEMYFVFCGTLWYICVISFVLRIMICSQDLREIIIKNFTAINKECFKWDYNPFQKQPPKVFQKKSVLKNFAIFTGKNLCSLESLFNKAAGLKPCHFI